MPSLTSIDLFAGAGGLSLGLSKEGFRVVTAVEIDATSAASYKLNHAKTDVLVDDVCKITGPYLLKRAGIQRGELSLLTGCPPCQGFSTLRTNRKKVVEKDPRNKLISEVLRLVRSIRPQAVIIENVPGLAADRRFAEFRKGLKNAGYNSEYQVINASDFGIPQRRKRLVLVALRDQDVPQDWSHSCSKTRTVRHTISHLDKPGLSGDRLHDMPENRTPAMMHRIRATPKDGGSRRDLPPELQCECHLRSGGYHDVYGRMKWDSVSPTITGGCNNPSRGRFLHPEEDRAITLREAALLQTFPEDYQFCLERGKEHVARQIGNAFPPELIRPIARVIKEALLA